MAVSGYDPRAFPPFAVTADIAVFTIVDGQLMVAAVERAQAPHQGELALPGGFVHPDENLDTAARRELIEETGLKAAVPHIAQFRAYGDPDRDPRMRVVTIAYWAIVPRLGMLIPGGDAASAHLVRVEDLLHGRFTLAFDHRQILGDAIVEARRALETTTVATAFCDHEFTIPELRQVYETVWGVSLDPGNFQKKVTEIPGFVIPTGDRRFGGPGRPAETFITGSARLIDPPFRRPSRSAVKPPRFATAAMMQGPDAMEMPPAYPLLDRELFDQLPKAKKSKDVQRMLHSSRSEDWVTWNVVRLLSRRPWRDWWPQLLETVSTSADQRIDLPPPDLVDLWKAVPAPLAYERASRERMLASDNQAWLARAANPKPVEGESEIEVSLAGHGYLIFAEAKLDADISPRTTYDPYRNQLIRNIDCVLEYSRGRQPHFWMFTRDRDPDRLYMQLINLYRADPGGLAKELSHKPYGEVEELTRTLAVVTWSELLDLVTPGDREEKGVYAELRRRVTPGRSSSRIQSQRSPRSVDGK